MLDLHCHVLFGVDDGAPDLPTAVAMAEVLVRAGFRRVAASPHAGGGPGGDVEPPVAALLREQLGEALSAAKLPLELLANAEHCVTPELLGRAGTPLITPIGGRGRWVLTELPWHDIPDVEGTLFRLQAKGYHLLLAHPERYGYLSVEVLERLVSRGVRLQLEIGSFCGLYGGRAQQRALELADQGLAHVLATDLHRPKDAEVWIPHGLRNVADRYGRRAVELALRHTPAALLDDPAPEALAPFSEGRPAGRRR